MALTPTPTPKPSQIGLEGLTVNTYTIVQHGSRYMVRVDVHGILSHYLTGEYRYRWQAERAARADGATTVQHA